MDGGILEAGLTSRNLGKMSRLGSAAPKCTSRFDYPKNNTVVCCRAGRTAVVLLMRFEKKVVFLVDD
jgi:hypothetical protein